MTALPKYRHLIAATLLALYAFVATPVQWWHHHHTTTETPAAAGSREAKQAIVAKATGSTAESGCQICSHKYSTYTNDALVPFVSSLQLTTVKNGYYRLPVISTGAYLAPGIEVRSKAQGRICTYRDTTSGPHSENNLSVNPINPPS